VLEESAGWFSRAGTTVNSFGKSLEWVGTKALKNIADILPFVTNKANGFVAAMENHAKSLHKTVYTQEKLKDVLAGVADGTTTYKDLKLAVEEVGVSSTATGKKLKESLASTNTEAKAELDLLLQMGAIDMSMTVDEILAIAAATGKVKLDSQLAIDALKEIIELGKQAASSANIGLPQTWGAEQNKRKSNTPETLAAIEREQFAIDELRRTLSAKELEDFRKYNEAKEAIAQRSNENILQKEKEIAALSGSINSTENKEELIRINKEFYERDLQLQREASALQLAEVNSSGQAQSKLRKSIKAQEILDSKLKKAAILGDVAAQQKASIDALEEYTTARQLAMKNATDPKELANNFKKANETEETSLSHSQKLNADALLAKKISREAYDKEDIRLTEESYRKQAELATANYEFLLKLQKEPNSGVSATDTTNAYKKQEEADRKLTDFRVANIEEIDTAGGKSAEKFAEYTNRRLEVARRAAEEEAQLIKKVAEANALAVSSEIMNELELERARAESLPTEYARITAIGEAERKMGQESLRFLQQQLADKKQEWEDSNTAIIALQGKLASYEASLSSQASATDIERTEESIALVQKGLDSEIAIRGAAHVEIINMEAATQRRILQLKLDAIWQEKAAAGANLSDTENNWRRGRVSVEEYQAAVKRAADANAITMEESNRRMVLSSDDVFATMKLGLEDWVATVPTLAESTAAMVGDIMNAMASGLTDAFMAFADGSKSAGEAFKDFARTFLQELARMIMQQMIFNALRTMAFGGGGEVPAAGKADGGSIGKYAPGGKIRGYSRHPKEDNIPIMATAGEFMQPVKAVQHYGLGFMEAIRTLSFPKNAYSMQFPKSATPTPAKTGYADGGGISAPPEPTVFKGGDTKLKIVNVLDKNLVGDYLKTNEGETILMNILRRNGSTLRSITG
jgi:hypothetical protein